MTVALRLTTILRRANGSMEENSRPRLRKRFKRCWIRGSTSLTSIFCSTLRSASLSKQVQQFQLKKTPRLQKMKLKNLILLSPFMRGKGSPERKTEMSYISFTIVR